MVAKQISVPLGFTNKRKPEVEHVFYTMGYQGLSIDEFIDILQRKGVKDLIDVRERPLSRKAGFSKTSFTSHCNAAGIEYHHFKEVGIPSALRKNLNSQVAYDLLFQHYEKEILPMQSESLTKIETILKERTSVLVCFEEDPKQCHRTRLGKKISSRTGIPMKHL